MANDNVPQIEVRNIADLVGLSNNPRRITKAGMARLVDSIRTNGFWAHRPIAISNRTGKEVIICGNQRLKAAKKLHLKTVPVIVYDNISEEREKDIIFRDNINNGEWDIDMLQDDEWSDISFDNIGLELPDIDDTPKSKKRKQQPEDINDAEEEDEESNEKEAFYRSMLSDCLYESNNIYDIPNLLKQEQAGKLMLPFSAWGAESRQKKGIATYHFYVDDYRFEAIWKDPVKVLISGCAAIVEPNLSLFDTTPIAYGLQQIYKKRWISRYFQECGIKVYADLNVARKFYEYNQMGIPEGYNAFFTRGYADRLLYLEEEHSIAKKISGLDTPNLIVYGGGKIVQEYCAKHSLVYVEQLMTSKKNGKDKR